MWTEKSKYIVIFINILIAGLAPNAFSDSKPYDGEVRISDEGREIFVTHVHSRSHGRKWYESQVRSLSACDYTDSSQGVLQAFRKSERIFCTAVPALTHIWLAPDERYIVGLSNIKWGNSFQVVVYSISGDLLFRHSINCRDMKRSECSESVTNYVFWFHETHPGIVLKEKGDGTLELSLNSPVKSRISFVFPAKPITPLGETPCGKNWQEISAETYWFYYLQGKSNFESEKDGVSCVSVHALEGDNYYYITRDELSNRTVQERIFLDFFDMALEHASNPNMTQAAVDQLKLWLHLIAGVKCATKAQCVAWVMQHHRERLALSEDGKYLVEE